jgi:uncharacterized protein YggE
MKKVLVASLFVSLLSLTVSAQVTGNRAYDNPGAQQGDSARRLPRYPETQTEQVLSDYQNSRVTTYQFIDVKVLTSVDTKEYVAVFGLAQQADTVQAANKKLQEQVAAFQRNLSALGVRPEDTYLDFITQNRVYDYVVKGGTAREKVSGFQIKQNLAVRYKDSALLDQMVPAAAQAGIFDLIKVDYVTGDLNAVRAQMSSEAQKALKRKEEDYARLGLKLSPVSVAAENFDAFQPFEGYSSYKAFEAGNVDGAYNVVEQRKNSTLFFEPLPPGKFDVVLAPIGLQPQVQCTFFLRMKYLVHNPAIVTPDVGDKKP